MEEVARVLKIGGKAVLTFGPCVPSLKQTVTLGAVHRLYHLTVAEDMADKVGLKCQATALWQNGWLSSEAVKKRITDDRKMSEIPYAYLFAVMEK